MKPIDYSTSARRSSSTISLSAWLLVLPFLLGFVIFTLYPLVKSLVLSFQQTYGPGHAQWVGVSNFAALTKDPLFWTALRNTTVFTLASVFIQLPLALLLAIVLNRPDVRAKAWFRLAFFSPSLVGIAFVALIFGVLLNQRTGLVNVTLNALFGFDLDFPWLTDHVMAALVVATLWMYVGFNMVYFLAALQNVRQELVEAAILDGAGPIRRFFAVTLPAIRPVAGFVVLLSIIGSFQLFELPFILLQGAGPNNRGLTIVLFLYQKGFEVGDLGYASAVGWILAIVLIVLAVLQRRISTAGGAEASTT